MSSAPVTPQQAALAARRSVWRDNALRTASRLFAADGFRETSMQQIAKAGGLTLRALYEAFPSKDDLFLAVLEHAFEDVFPLLEGPPDDTDPSTRVLDAIDGLFASIEHNREAFQLRTHAVGGAATPLRDGRDAFEHYEAAARTQLAALVAAAHPVGAPDPDVTARAIISTVTALAASAIAEEPREPVTRMAPNARKIFAPLFGEA